MLKGKVGRADLITLTDLERFNETIFMNSSPNNRPIAIPGIGSWPPRFVRVTCCPRDTIIVLVLFTLSAIHFYGKVWEIAFEKLSDEQQFISVYK
jgi:hypothetical protein